MHVKLVLFMSMTNSITKNTRFGLYEVKINENASHLAQVTSVLSHCRMESQLAMLVEHILLFHDIHLVTAMFSSSISYYQRVTRARSFESILFQAI